MNDDGFSRWAQLKLKASASWFPCIFPQQRLTQQVKAQVKAQVVVAFWRHGDNSGGDSLLVLNQ